MRTQLAILSGLLLLLSPLAGLTAVPDQSVGGIQATPPTAAADTGPALASPSANVPSSMMVEIEALLAAEAEAVADLHARFQAATNETVALAIMMEIGRVKVETELNILRVQIRYARADGRVAVAEELEAAIEKMTSPPEIRQPQPRSVADGPHQ